MCNKCIVIAIFGLSGVGKSTLISRFLKDNPTYVHVQAGTLIKNAFKNAPRDTLRMASTDTIIKNQYLLIDEFWKDVQENGYSSVIFDGHSIIDNEHEIIKIPCDIIRKLNPQKIIYVEDVPEEIRARRNADQTRLRADKTISQIEMQQNISKEHARSYAADIGIPFETIKSGDLEKLKAHIYEGQ